MTRTDSRTSDQLRPVTIERGFVRNSPGSVLIRAGGTVVLVTGVKVAEGKLSWNETVPGYVDVMAAKGTYKPASFDASYTFSVVEGKLRTVYDEVFFDVDPDTLKRTPTKEKIPPMVANELECK